MTAKKKTSPKAGNSVTGKQPAANKYVAVSRAVRAYVQPDFNSFKLQINGEELSGTQSEIFFKRLEELEKANVHRIYRGDKKDRILSKFNLHPNNFPTIFNDYLFMIGDKGRHFWENAVKKGRRTFPVFSLEDTSKEFLELIFDLLRSIITRKDYPAPLQLRLQKFSTENPAFIEFFKYKKNKKEFVAKIQNASPGDCLKTRDYYLTLLHQFGNNDFYPVSFLLSATERFSVAKSFIRWEQIADNGIIFFGWVPRSEGYLLYTRFGLFAKKIAQSIKLPTTGMFYREQYEITLKGGLLPHYIIGYFYRQNGIECFELNPAIFKIEDSDWPLDGLPINQTQFGERIRDTQFKKAFFVTPPGDYYEF